ncbi:MAG: hypothetical protein WC417_02710, partial [Candidatus Omnitrophota bacterium]
MKILKYSFIVLLLVTSYRVLVIESRAEPQDTIRVAIIQGISTLNIKISGPYEVNSADNNAVLYQGRNLKTTVTTYKDG